MAMARASLRQPPVKASSVERQATSDTAQDKDRVEGLEPL